MDQRTQLLNIYMYRTTWTRGLSSSIYICIGPHGPEDSAPQYQHLFYNVTTHHTPAYDFAPNPDKQWILRHTDKMQPIHKVFIHSFFHSSCHSYFHPYIHSFILSFILSFLLSSLYSFMYSFSSLARHPFLLLIIL